jgi:hypothetical protein
LTARVALPDKYCETAGLDAPIKFLNGYFQNNGKILVDMYKVV